VNQDGEIVLFIEKRSLAIGNENKVCADRLKSPTEIRKSLSTMIGGLSHSLLTEVKGISRTGF